MMSDFAASFPFARSGCRSRACTIALAVRKPAITTNHVTRFIVQGLLACRFSLGGPRPKPLFERPRLSHDASNLRGVALSPHLQRKDTPPSRHGCRFPGDRPKKDRRAKGIFRPRRMGNLHTRTTKDRASHTSRQVTAVGKLDPS